jgi:2-polyprenyl-6-methoxyphenol hydroxylase-like FAD-dependent oxidoreductase
LPTVTDVLVVGGGPIGLLCAYQLGKFSRGKTRVVVIGGSTVFPGQNYEKW